MSVISDPSEEALIGLNRLATVARLLSGAIHDVNNALQVISGTVEILEARPDVPPSMHDSLARLKTQSTRAAGTLTQVVQFTRSVRTGQQPLNLRELAEESLALRSFAIRKARLTSRIETEGAGPFVAVANQGDLQQVLLNLLMNAEQALAGGSGVISVRLAIEEGMVVVRVEDQGRGVSLQPVARIFDPFVTTNDVSESPGLGLWAARALVEQHGGTLTLENSSAAGSVFAMRLPLIPLKGRV